MADVRIAEALAHARELEERDAELRAALDQVDVVGREATEIAARSQEIARFLARLPAERERATAAVAAAERDVERTGSLLDRAKAELDEAEARRGDEHALAVARHRLEAAASALRAAEGDLGGAHERSAALEVEAEEQQREARVLEGRAVAAAAVAAGLARLSGEGKTTPQPGLEGLVRWARTTRTSVFVARSGLERERDSLVRQANELAAGLLDEPSFATNVALVRRRLEREIA